MSARMDVLSAIVVTALLVSVFSFADPPGSLRSPERNEPLDTTSPIIEWTSPAHGQVVYPDADVVIRFNESMKTSSFTCEFLSGWDPGMNWSWESTVYENDTVRGTHAALFSSPATYELNVTYAEDVAGNPLAPGPVPNPWNWSTIVVIVSTDPAHGETDVDTYQDIMVSFSGSVDPASSITWAIFPDPGGWIATWGAGDTIVMLSHINPFDPCSWITVAFYLDGFPFPSLVPNPWWFQTECPLRIIHTDPYHGQTDVPLDHDIVIEWSKPMDPGTVMWTIDPPHPGGWNQSWSVNNTVLTLSHTVPFLDCQLYEVAIVEGRDMDGYMYLPGYDLVPNPWSFTTVCLPKITVTDPSDGQTNVPLDNTISAVFSKPMNTTSVSWTIVPFVDLFPMWDLNDANLTLLPTQPFEVLTAYTVEIQGKDKNGNGLVAGPVPNPWTFYTGIEEHLLKSTDPYHGEVDVALTRPIIVRFSRSIDVHTFTYMIVPFIALTVNWMDGDKTVMLTHLDEFESSTLYTMAVSGNDLDGMPIPPGPVPNPWSWTTAEQSPQPPPAPPTAITASLSGAQLQDVTITWQLSDDDPGGGVSHYDIFRGIDVYDGSGLSYSHLASVPAGVSVFVNQLVGLDEHDYFYLVCAVGSNGSSCTENQAAKFTRQLIAGPNLVSVPLVLSDESIGTVLQTVKYDRAWFYDSSSGEWKWHMTAKGYGGLTDLSHTIGLWVNVTGDCNFHVAGLVPAQTTIHLREGWNLVSFPSFNSSYTVADLKAELPVERVEGFDASAPPHFLRVLQDSDVLLAGEGYWVKVSADVAWVVSNG
ncbi:MAG: Ig-like domain-containing protein [Thermoplasmata archaeon]